MTSPSGQTPANAANANTFAGWAQTTEAEWKDQILGHTQKPFQGIGTWSRLLKDSPLTQIPVLGGIISALTGRVDKAEKVAVQAGSVAASTANIAVTTGFIDGQYFIRQTYVANGNWTPPAIPPGAKRTGYGVQCIGGGEGGGKPRQATLGAPGGRHGGLAFRQVTVAQMGTGARAVTVGAGGFGATAEGFGQLGGISKFSNLLTSVPGGTSIQTIQGVMGSAARPGRGGDGGAVVVSDVGNTSGTDTSSGSAYPIYSGAFGSDGESTSGAPGGRGGSPSTTSGGWFPTTTPGSLPQAGADASSDDNLAPGGAGGGGGAGNAGAAGQNGAPGGDPGGGGGGGGSSSGRTGFIVTQPNPTGNGGQGRNGRVDVWTYYTVEETA